VRRLVFSLLSVVGLLGFGLRAFALSFHVECVCLGPVANMTSFCVGRLSTLPFDAPLPHFERDALVTCPLPFDHRQIPSVLVLFRFFCLGVYFHFDHKHRCKLGSPGLCG